MNQIAEPLFFRARHPNFASRTHNQPSFEPRYLPNRTSKGHVSTLERPCFVARLGMFGSMKWLMRTATSFHFSTTSLGKFAVLLMVQIFSAGMVYDYCKDKAKALQIASVSIGITLVFLPVLQ
jgi:hypothetical protein